ncbi:hypothetical protein [Kordia sp.]|uniref:hypothetical protein n=1 Tax=Kordia sp. TaxID=1965332 RepID=UPI003D2B4F85
MKTTHTKQNKESKDQKLKPITKINKSLVLGTIVAIIIAVSPYIFYLYKGLPRTKIWQNPFFTYKVEYYEDVNIYFWLLLARFIPFLLLVLWFFTCKHWWYHVILIPVAMYAFQLFTVLNNESDYIDEMEIAWIIPIMMIIIPFVYLIRIKLFDKLVLGIDLKKIEAELDEYDRKEKEAQNKIETK